MTDSFAFSGSGGGSRIGTFRVSVSSGSPIMPVCNSLDSEVARGFVCGLAMGLLFPARGHHGLENIVVGSTAAQMPANGLLDVVQIGTRIVVDQGRAAHHHSRRAEAALHRVVLDESVLDGMQLAVTRKAFDRRDFLAARIE